MSAAPDTATVSFERAVIDAFGLTRSFWLLEAGPRAVMIACRERKPRDGDERIRLETLHRRANRLAELEPPARRLNWGAR